MGHLKTVRPASLRSEHARLAPSAPSSAVRGTGGVRKRSASETEKASALLRVEPMTGIEPAYSAWEVDSGRPGPSYTGQRSLCRCAAVPP